MCSCLSVFLAKVLGLYLFITCFSTLLYQQRCKKIIADCLAHPPSMALCGLLGVIVGLLIVVTHNVWMSGWPVLVTLIGWISLLQGIARLYIPDAFVKVYKDMLNKVGFQVWTWVWLLIGVYLIWVGFSQNG